MMSAVQMHFRSGLAITALIVLAFGAFYAWFHSEGNLIKRLDSSSESVRCSAAEEISKKGPAASFALPKLEAMLVSRPCEDTWGNDKLFGYLEAIDGIDPMVRAMKNTPGFDNPKIAWWLRSNSHRYPQRAHDVVPVFIGGLHSENPLVRHASAEGLGTLGPAASDAVPDLESDLQDTDPDVRRSAAESLGNIRSLDGLMMALTNHDPQVRHIAIMRLGGMSGAEFGGAVKGYNEMLNDPELSELGRKELMKTNPPPSSAYLRGFDQAALPSLINALEDPDPNNATAAAGRLVNFGRAALPALDALKNSALHAASPATRSAALHALRSIGPEGLPTINEALQDPDSDVRNYANRLVASYAKSYVPLP